MKSPVHTEIGWQILDNIIQNGQNWNQPKCLSAGERVDSLKGCQRKGHSLAVKKEKTTRVPGSQETVARHRKLHIVGVHLYEFSGKGKIAETDSRLVFTSGPVSKQRLMANDTREPYGDGNVLKPVVVVLPQWHKSLKLWHCQVKMVKCYCMCILPQKGPGAVDGIRGANPVLLWSWVHVDLLGLEKPITNKTSLFVGRVCCWSQPLGGVLSIIYGVDAEWSFCNCGQVRFMWGFG